MTFLIKLALVTICFRTISTRPEDKLMHPRTRQINDEPHYDHKEDSAQFWNDNAQRVIKEQLSKTRNIEIAKNVIIFMGDGMSVPTLAATRVYMGAENSQLSFEKFPHTAISKTYCVDYQVPDSACTATAYLCGVKGNEGTVGVTAAVPWADCKAMTNTSNHVNSIAYWSQLKNKSTGFVTTARVTHASPAGVFAHTAQRDWETDTDILLEAQDPKVCDDVAKQLIYGDVGKKLNVIIGGGRYALLPNTTKDEEGEMGYRSDGLNLIEEWQKIKKDEKKSFKYLWNRDDLLNLDYAKTDYLLALFESSHCNYNLERDPKLDPSLSEMTEAALKILTKNPNGYFLFVEGGRIDMAHHEAKAHKAFDETVEFSKAVEIAINMTSQKDTLIVVTSDHAHTMSMGGYPFRGNDILGIAEEQAADDGLPFLTINYANGPGYLDEGGKRHNVSQDDLENIDYQYPAVFPLDSETHGGDDVIVFAQGPWAHLFSGVMEENVVSHIMMYASCVGEGLTACDKNGGINHFSPMVFVYLTMSAVAYNVLVF